MQEGLGLHHRCYLLNELPGHAAGAVALAKAQHNAQHSELRSHGVRGGPSALVRMLYCLRDSCLLGRGQAPHTAQGVTGTPRSGPHTQHPRPRTSRWKCRAWKLSTSRCCRSRRWAWLIGQLSPASASMWACWPVAHATGSAVCAAACWGRQRAARRSRCQLRSVLCGTGTGGGVALARVAGDPGEDKAVWQALIEIRCVVMHALPREGTTRACV
jgi:hypothetical protein